MAVLFLLLWVTRGRHTPLVLGLRGLFAYWEMGTQNIHVGWAALLLDSPAVFKSLSCQRPVLPLPLLAAGSSALPVLLHTHLGLSLGLWAPFLLGRAFHLLTHPADRTFMLLTPFCSEGISIFLNPVETGVFNCRRRCVQHTAYGGVILQDCEALGCGGGACLSILLRPRSECVMGRRTNEGTEKAMQYFPFLFPEKHVHKTSVLSLHPSTSWAGAPAVSGLCGHGQGGNRAPCPLLGAVESHLLSLSLFPPGTWGRNTAARATGMGQGLQGVLEPGTHSYLWTLSVTETTGTAGHRGRCCRCC